MTNENRQSKSTSMAKATTASPPPKAASLTTTTTTDDTPTRKRRTRPNTPDTRYAKRAQRDMLRDRRSKIFRDCLRKQSKNSPKTVQTTTTTNTPSPPPKANTNTPRTPYRGHTDTSYKTYTKCSSKDVCAQCLRAKVKKSKVKVKTPALSNKQRSKQAREHYELHHSKPPSFNNDNTTLWVVAAPYPDTPSPSLWWVSKLAVVGLVSSQTLRTVILANV